MPPTLPSDSLRPGEPRLSEEMIDQIEDAANRLPSSTSVFDVPSSHETVVEMPAKDGPFALDY